MLAIIERGGRVTPIKVDDPADWFQKAQIALATELPVTIILEDLVINVQNGAIAALDMFSGKVDRKDATPAQVEAIVRLAVEGSESDALLYEIAEPWMEGFAVRIIP